MIFALFNQAQQTSQKGYNKLSLILPNSIAALALTVYPFSLLCKQSLEQTNMPIGGKVKKMQYLSFNLFYFKGYLRYAEAETYCYSV